MDNLPVEPGSGTMCAGQNPAGRHRTLSPSLNSVMVRGHIAKATVNTYKVESWVPGKRERNAGFAGITAYLGKRSVPAPGSLRQAQTSAISF